jgi:hypothetical protein
MARRNAQSPSDTALEYEPEDIELEEEESKALGDLADLDSQKFSDYEWNIYRLRTAEDMAKSGTRSPRVWIAKRVGPVNLNEIQADYGGGWFEFWGRLNGVTKFKFRREIDGDPKVFKPDASGKTSLLAPNGDASSSVSVEEAVRRAVARERRRAQVELERHQRSEEQKRLEAQIAELKQLVSQAASRPAVEQKPERLKDLAETMVMLRSLAPEGSAMNPLELLQTARQWMEQGILLGEKREPGTSEGGDGWNAERITAIAQAVAQVLSRFTPPRREPPRGAQATQQPATAPNADVPLADVVPPAAQATQATSDPHYRWKSAIETVARNMVRGRGPDDTAASIEDTLNEEELKNLKGEQGPDGVWHPTVPEALDWLEGQGIGPFPQLRSPGGLVYTESVLTELRRPEDSETE